MLQTRQTDDFYKIGPKTFIYYMVKIIIYNGFIGFRLALCVWWRFRGRGFWKEKCFINSWTQIKRPSPLLLVFTIFWRGRFIYALMQTAGSLLNCRLLRHTYCTKATVVLCWLDIYCCISHLHVNPGPTFLDLQFLSAHTLMDNSW